MSNADPDGNMRSATPPPPMESFSSAVFLLFKKKPPWSAQGQGCQRLGNAVGSKFHHSATECDRRFPDIDSPNIPSRDEQNWSINSSSASGATAAIVEIVTLAIIVCGIHHTNQVWLFSHLISQILYSVVSQSTASRM
jgi:hypothetical protein